MVESVVIISASTMAGLGLLFAGLLGFAHSKLKVEENPEVTEIEDILPGLDCGACGYPGCHQLAKNVAGGDAPPDSCVPGGEEVARKIADVLGMEVSSEPGRMRLAVVHCGAGDEEKQWVGQYEGVKSCRTAELTTGGNLKCEYGCLGYGDCARACPFDAIEMVDGLPKVDPDACTACGECVETCPRDIIAIEELDLAGDFVKVACNSEDEGPAVRGKCDVGCIACGLCEKMGPDEVFSVEDNLSRMDYSNYGEEADFEMAIDKCPTGCIVEFPSPDEDSETD
jgi:RnfABCDGE-type electron transport complex B subunit